MRLQHRHWQVTGGEVGQVACGAPGIYGGDDRSPGRSGEGKGGPKKGHLDPKNVRWKSWKSQNIKKSTKNKCKLLSQQYWRPCEVCLIPNLWDDLGQRLSRKQRGQGHQDRLRCAQPYVVIYGHIWLHTYIYIFIATYGYSNLWWNIINIYGNTCPYMYTCICICCFSLIFDVCERGQADGG